jgi:hypothetical protein
MNFSLRELRLAMRCLDYIICSTSEEYRQVEQPVIVPENGLLNKNPGLKYCREMCQVRDYHLVLAARGSIQSSDTLES